MRRRRPSSGSRKFSRNTRSGRAERRSPARTAQAWDPSAGPLHNRGRTVMAILTRRSLLRASLGVAAAGTLARPYVANAQAKTAQVWWTQGFIRSEDESFRKLAADYEKASGNK